MPPRGFWLGLLLRFRTDGVGKKKVGKGHDEINWGHVKLFWLAQGERGLPWRIQGYTGESPFFRAGRTLSWAGSTH